MTLRLRRPPALRHRNFRIFYSGQFISLIGTWMQMAAQNWLVYSITGSAEKLGEVSVMQAVPGLLVTAWGGVIADRYSKKSILLVTQTVSMVLALVLFVLVYRGLVAYEQIVVLALLLGFVNAIDMPTRGAFVVDLVGKEDLHSAIALNSSIFNASRILGPAVAGVVVASFGTANCFLINALSFLGPIIGLLFVRLPAVPQHEERPSALGQLLEGFAFIRGHHGVRSLVVVMAGTSVLAWGVGVLLPIFAGEVLHAGPTGYGFLMAANGIGAMIGALRLSMAADHPASDRVLRRRVLGGVLIFCAASIAFAWCRSLPLCIAIEIAAGWASIMYFSTSNTWLQLLAPDAVRGRVFGFYHTMFQGFMPLGAFITAWIAQRLGAPMALTLMMTSCAIFVIAVGGRRRFGHE